MINAMAWECRYGLMVPSTRATGRTTRPTVMGSFGTLMAIYVAICVGSLDEGDWVDDKANGHGTYTHINGANYVGQWKEDL